MLELDGGLVAVGAWDGREYIDNPRRGRSMRPAELAIICPTLGRADRLEPLVENIADTAPPVYRILFVLDADDQASWDAAWEIAGANPASQVAAPLGCDGTLAIKANAGAAATTEPWMLLIGDDVLFHPGWWQATLPARQNPAVGVIGTNDLHNRHVKRGEYATQFLMARWYLDKYGTIDEPGKMVCPLYHHDPVDVECCETAQARGMYAHMHGAKIEHLHPDHGLREVDDTDRKGQLADKKADLALLRERRKLWRKLVSAED